MPPSPASTTPIPRAVGPPPKMPITSITMPARIVSSARGNEPQGAGGSSSPGVGFIRGSRRRSSPATSSSASRAGRSGAGSASRRSRARRRRRGRSAALELRWGGQHALEQVAVAGLELGSPLESQAGLGDPLGEFVAHPLQLTEAERSAAWPRRRPRRRRSRPAGRPRRRAARAGTRDGRSGAATRRAQDARRPLR